MLLRAQLSNINQLQKDDSIYHVLCQYKSDIAYHIYIDNFFALPYDQFGWKPERSYKLLAMKTKKMISTGDFARATGTPYPTVVRWAQNGVIPGVEREETFRGPVWLVPQDALDTFEQWKPKIGRPQKPKEKKDGRKRKE